MAAVPQPRGNGNPQDSFDATLVQDSCELVSDVDVIRVAFRGARALDAIAIRCCTPEHHLVDKARIQGIWAASIPCFVKHPRYAPECRLRDRLTWARHGCRYA